jgi:dihydrofolate reductase
MPVRTLAIWKDSDTVSSAKEAALLFPDAWVIGGAQVYEAMCFVSEVWLSHISVETKARIPSSPSTR